MGILDEAIKEHLELKRQHGAGESELQQLEDEAFGAAERPGDEEPQSDALAEAPTEFMSQPGAPEATGEEASTQRPAPQIADLQEAPPALDPEAPAEEEAPAMEHEAVPEPVEPDVPAEPESPAGPSTEERHAIAEQPTEMYDVEEELAASESRPPSEEELIEEATAEPRLAPVDPLAEIEEPVDEDAEIQVEEVDADDPDDEFWDEKRLSDELDQALEAPPESEPEPPEPPVGKSEPEEDVLEETPDFLEEAPEDDQLWFEQKPPKDFDFDD